MGLTLKTPFEAAVALLNGVTAKPIVTSEGREVRVQGFKPRGSIYTTYGIRHQKNHPYFGFGDLIP